MLGDAVTRARLGFLGVGWIGRNRMEAIADAGCADIAAIADPSREQRTAAIARAPDAIACEHLGQLLEVPLDGIVIATPSALHVEHCLAALGRGLAVFCQKPLARTAAEAQQVVDAARFADRMLGVDLAYRHTSAMRRIREVVRSGGIGRVFAVDLTFHSAYGPDAAWFYDKAAAGGGCVIDVGVHLVDLALWALDFPRLLTVDSRLFARGEAIDPGASQVEDFASVHIHLAGGVIVRLACSWRASAGRDAVIEASMFGTAGGVAMKNIDGSFDDFVAERYSGARADTIASPPDQWGGRAVIDWAERLGRDGSFDREAERFVDVARVIDAIYERGAHRH